jgi:aspartate/methionine/tyrosine aminotransferase
MADFGGGETAAKTLWKGCGVKVLPGNYLTKSHRGQADHGRDYIRLALVQDAETTREGLARIVATLG